MYYVFTILPSWILPQFADRTPTLHLLEGKTISRSPASLSFSSAATSSLNCLNTQQKVTRGHSQTIYYQGTPVEKYQAILT